MSSNFKLADPVPELLARWTAVDGPTRAHAKRFFDRVASEQAMDLRIGVALTRIEFDSGEWMCALKGRARLLELLLYCSKSVGRAECLILKIDTDFDTIADGNSQFNPT